MLTEYLAEDKILLNFEASDFKQALKKMLSVSSEKEHSQIINKIIKRESLMPTSLGKGIALPRVIIDDKEKAEIIVAISREGIKLNSLDLHPIKIIFLFLFPKKFDYSPILAQSLKLLNEDSLKTELINSDKNDKVIAVIKKWEE